MMKLEVFTLLFERLRSIVNLIRLQQAIILQGACFSWKSGVRLVEGVGAEGGKVVGVERALLGALENSGEVGLGVEVVVGLGGIYFNVSVLHLDVPLECRFCAVELIASTNLAAVLHNQILSCSPFTLRCNKLPSSFYALQRLHQLLHHLLLLPRLFQLPLKAQREELYSRVLSLFHLLWGRQGDEVGVRARSQNLSLTGLVKVTVARYSVSLQSGHLFFHKIINKQKRGSSPLPLIQKGDFSFNNKIKLGLLINRQFYDEENALYWWMGRFGEDCQRQF